MKIIRGKNIKSIPASHEDNNNPGCLKKVLATKNDIVKGQVQMINWSTLIANKNFEPHYHTNMQEIFIILNGSCEVEVEGEKDVLNAGDVVIIDEKQIHKMTNKSGKNVDYIAIGVARGENGKTVRV